MNTYERRQSLLELLRKQPGLRVPEIARTMAVSEGTVRNDLNALEAAGHLRRMHGGAVLSGRSSQFASSFGARYQVQGASKLAIARTVSLLVEDGASLLLDASSTVYYLARQLENRNRLRVVTNGIDVARLLANNSTNTVVLMGGVVAPDGSSVTGSLSEQIIRDLHVQMAFVSCSGFSLGRGLTDVLLAEAELKGKAIASAREVFALVDSSKMGKEDLTSFASLNQIAHVYTDSGLSDEWSALLRAAGVAFTICSAN
ncbi:MAG TPA: DeoR/GlpR family DNA-binding transcription regulator [Anaerolineales bacterium]|nr:DeoR/GlpR family DNA-binding transcription regulator [Anaerolineales bacterium]